MALQRTPLKWVLLGAALLVLLGLAITAMVRAPALDPASAQAAAPIIVVWTTKSEINTAGFNLYRAQSEQGDFVRLNRDLIPAANDPVTGGTYVFTDTNTLASVTYYYQLEDVELNGTRSRHGTISYTAEARGPMLFGFALSDWLVAFTALGLLGVALGALVWMTRRANR